MTWPADLLPSLGGVLILIILATAVLWFYGAPRRFAPALAVLRGALQLAVISVVLTGVIRDPFWVGVALVVMFAAAVFTAARRLSKDPAYFGIVAVAMAVGIGVTLAIVFLTGAIEFSARYVLAIGGIVIGNAMTMATLAGRRFSESVDERWEEVEGWLALGATPRQATHELTRRSVYSALIPATDQTKTTGLVTLPGAFVGAIFGGVSPLEAGRFQIVVLAALIAAGTLTAVVLITWLAPIRVRPTLPT